MIRARDPAQASAIAGEDLSAFIAEPLHVCLIEGKSLGIFAWRGPGVYELHVHYEVRGREAIDLLRAMIETMRQEHGGRYFWTSIPAGLRHVRIFARLVGLKSDGMTETDRGPHELFYSEKPICP